MSGGAAVLIALVVCVCAVTVLQAHQNQQQHAALTKYLTDTATASTEQVLDVVNAWHGAILHVEQKRLEYENRRDELQAALSHAELQARVEERVAALKQPLVPLQDLQGLYDTTGQLPNYSMDIDPTNIDPLPTLAPTFDEQQSGGYAMPTEHEPGVVVPVGTSLIPGAENEARDVY